MDRQELIGRIDGYIADHRGEILEDLKSLVRIPSVSREGEDGLPFGKACAQVLELALSKAEARGFYCNNHNNWYGTAFYASHQEDESLIGIFSHLDVVEAGDDWIYDPFEPTEVNGFLIGRGAGDNKSGAIIGLYAMQLLKELELPLRSNVMLYFGTNEEKGMKDAERFAKEHIMPDYSIVPDLFFPVCFGEKGHLKLRVQAKTGFRQISRFTSGTADNLIPARAEADLPDAGELYRQAQSLAEGREDIVLTRRESGFTVAAKGTGGHSAMPQGKINAIHVLTTFLRDLPSLDLQDRALCSAMADFTGDYDGTALEIAFADEPSGPLVVTAVRAEMDGLLPGLLFSCRYPVTDCRDRIETAAHAALYARGFEIREVVNSDPLYVDREEPFVQRLMGVYREVTGKPNEPYIIDGGTYARKLKNAVGFGGGDGVRADFLPQGHGAVHQPDEARHIQGILDAIKIYVLSVLELDELLQEQMAR